MARHPEPALSATVRAPSENRVRQVLARCRASPVRTPDGNISSSSRPGSWRPAPDHRRSRDAVPSAMTTTPPWSRWIQATRIVIRLRTHRAIAGHRPCNLSTRRRRHVRAVPSGAPLARNAELLPIALRPFPTRGDSRPPRERDNSGDRWPSLIKACLSSSRSEVFAARALPDEFAGRPHVQCTLADTAFQRGDFGPLHDNNCDGALLRTTRHRARRVLSRIVQGRAIELR